MKSKMGVLVAVSIALTVAVALVFGSFVYTPKALNTQAQSTQNGSRKIHQTMQLDSLWQGSLRIEVANFQSTDAINIRPGIGDELEVSVYSMTTAEVSMSGGKTLAVPSPGANVSSSALSMSQDAVVFARPNTNDRFLIDVRLPDGSIVDIVTSGNEIASNALVYAPMVVKGASIGKGETNPAKALLKLIYGDLDTFNESQVVSIGDNELYVHFKKLQIQSSSALPSGVRAMLQINESGDVTGVQLLEPAGNTQIENNLQSWEFIPYTVNGVPQKVRTFVISE